MRIEAGTVFGDVDLIVPEGVEVEARSRTVFGDTEQEAGEAAPRHAPRIVLSGGSVFGDVRVRTERLRARRSSRPDAWSDRPYKRLAHARGEPDERCCESEECALLPWPSLRPGDGDHNRQENEEQDELERKAKQPGHPRSLPWPRNHERRRPIMGRLRELS
jgi:hypothetical protein